MSDKTNVSEEKKAEKSAQKGKPYKLTFSETYVEPIGMGEKKNIKETD